MALDARVVGGGVGQSRGVHDVGDGRHLDMLVSGTVALFAADIPLCHGLRLNIEVDRMTAVAERACGAGEIVTCIEFHPPVVFYDVGLPPLVSHIPLHGKGIVVVADFLEVALLPNAPIDKGHIVDGKSEWRVGF